MIHGGFFQEMICWWWIFHGIFHIYVGFEGSIFWQWTIPRLCTAISDYQRVVRWWGPFSNQDVPVGSLFPARLKVQKTPAIDAPYISVSNKNQPSSWNDMLFFRYSFTMFHSFCVYLTYSFHVRGSMIFMASFPSNTARPGQPSYRHVFCLSSLEGIVAVNSC
jgi:hypothetical protein